MSAGAFSQPLASPDIALPRGDDTALVYCILESCTHNSRKRTTSSPNVGKPPKTGWLRDDGRRRDTRPLPGTPGKRNAKPSLTSGAAVSDPRGRRARTDKLADGGGQRLAAKSVVTSRPSSVSSMASDFAPSGAPQGAGPSR